MIPAAVRAIIPTPPIKKAPEYPLAVPLKKRPMIEPEKSFDQLHDESLNVPLKKHPMIELIKKQRTMSTESYPTQESPLLPPGPSPSDFPSASTPSSSDPVSVKGPSITSFRKRLRSSHKVEVEIVGVTPNGRLIVIL